MAALGNEYICLCTSYSFFISNSTFVFFEKPSYLRHGDTAFLWSLQGLIVLTIPTHPSRSSTAFTFLRKTYQCTINSFINKGLLIYTSVALRFLPLSLYPLCCFHCSFTCEPLECRDYVFHLCLMSFLQGYAYWMICMKEGWKSRSFAQLHLAMFLWFLL